LFPHWVPSQASSEVSFSASISCVEKCQQWHLALHLCAAGGRIFPMDPGDCRDTSEKYEGFFMDSSQKDRGLKQEEIHIT